MKNMKNMKNYCAKWMAITVFLLGFLYSPFQIAMLVKDTAKESKLKTAENNENILYIFSLAVIPMEVVSKSPNQQQKISDYIDNLSQDDIHFKKIKSKFDTELKELTVGNIKCYIAEHIKDNLADWDKDFLKEQRLRMGDRMFYTAKNVTLKNYFSILHTDYWNSKISLAEYEKHIQDFVQISTLNRENYNNLQQCIHNNFLYITDDFSSLKIALLKIILRRAYDMLDHYHWLNLYLSYVN